MRPNRAGFWRDAVTIRGSITPIVMPCVLAFGLFATGLCALSWLIERVFHIRTGLEVAPYEIAGAGSALDQIGVELQNPFAKGNLSHLPLDDICRTIEANLTGMLRSPPPPAAATAEPTNRGLAGRAVR